MYGDQYERPWPADAYSNTKRWDGKVELIN